MVDMRVRAVNIDKQQVITKDNVPMSIDGVLFYKVEEAEHAVIRAQDHRQAIQLNARASLRDVIGQYTLDQVLTEQEAIGRSIQDAVGKETKEWGLIVTGLKLLELEVPEDLKKMMSRQAPAEREKRATMRARVRAERLDFVDPISDVKQKDKRTVVRRWVGTEMVQRTSFIPMGFFWNMRGQSPMLIQLHF